MDTQKYIDALNDRVSEADPNEALILAEAIEHLKEGDLSGTLIALNKLDLWLKQDSPWHNKIRDVYNEIRADIIQGK